MAHHTALRVLLTLLPTLTGVHPVHPALSPVYCGPPYTGPYTPLHHQQGAVRYPQTPRSLPSPLTCYPWALATRAIEGEDFGGVWSDGCIGYGCIEDGTRRVRGK